MRAKREYQSRQQQAFLREARDGRVICRVCGGRFQFLGSHLRYKHRMKIAEYRSLFGANLPAVSPSRRKAISKAGKRYFADPRNRLARRAKKRNELSDWDLSKGFSAGRPNSEIAREFHVKISTIEKRAHQLDFPGTNCPHYFGQPFDSEFAQYLKERSGLSAGELEAAIDAKKGSLTPLLYPHGGRQRNTPRLAADLIAWLDRILPALLRPDYRGKPNSLPGRKSDLISTFVPNFHTNFHLLLRALRDFRKFLLDNPNAGVVELKKYACDEAMFEVLKRFRKKVFVPFLKWSWQLDELMTREWERLRGTEPLEWVACEWVASRWSTEDSRSLKFHRGILYAALWRRCAKRAPDKMANLIRLLGTPLRPAPTVRQLQKRRPGRPASRRETFEQADLLHQQGMSWPKIAIRFNPGLSQKEAKAEGQRLRIGVREMKKARPSS